LAYTIGYVEYAIRTHPEQDLVGRAIDDGLCLLADDRTVDLIRVKRRIEAAVRKGGRHV
jgi:hypothetical protein